MAITIKDQVIEMTALGDAIPEWVNIAQIRWEGPTNAAHQMVLEDATGSTIIMMNAEAADQDVQVRGPGWVHGVRVEALGSGQVRLFVR